MRTVRIGDRDSIAVAGPEIVGIANILCPRGDALDTLGASVAAVVGNDFHSIAGNDVGVDEVAATDRHTMGGAVLRARTVTARNALRIAGCAVDVHVVLGSAALADTALGQRLVDWSSAVLVVPVVALFDHTPLQVFAGVHGVPLATVEWIRRVGEDTTTADGAVVHRPEHVSGGIHFAGSNDRHEQCHSKGSDLRLHFSIQQWRANVRNGFFGERKERKQTAIAYCIVT